MAAQTVHCHVLGGSVTIVSSIDGNVTNVVCSKFSRMTHTCAIKDDQQGFVAAVAAKTVDKVTGTRANYCEFTDPNDSPMAQFVRGLLGNR